MIAAIYARKSTDQGGLADEAKSVHRQIEHARLYAARKGWTIDDASLFVDDGISGAEFARRPGFVRLMAALKPRPPFDVLIMSEDSRLGREAIETSYALKQIITAGVRVFFYLEDRERTLDSPIEKAMLALQAMNDEMERAKASQRTKDALVMKHRQGHVTGGRVFGYDLVDVVHGERRLRAPGAVRHPDASHVERRINETEAAVVRRLFALAAAGVGQKHIAWQLNAEHAPSPRSQQGRPRSWAMSSVHALVHRELYRGVLVWNRTKKRDQWGQKRHTRRPESEWLRVPVPELRIVDEAVWQAAHAQIAEHRRDYMTATKGLRGGRTPVESKYLLPGMATCASCGGGLTVRTHNHGSAGSRRRAFFYACSTRAFRGVGACDNPVSVPMERLDAEVLGKIRDLLTPRLVDHVVARVRALRAPRQVEARHDRMADDLATVEARIGRLTEAIASGALSVPELVAQLQEAQRRREGLAQALVTAGSNDAPAWPALEAQTRALLEDWRGLLGRHAADARPVLRQLLEGRRIRFTPIVEAERRGYRFEGDAGIGGLLEGVVACQDGWRPHRVPQPADTALTVRFSGEVFIVRHAA